MDVAVSQGPVGQDHVPPALLIEGVPITGQIPEAQVRAEWVNATSVSGAKVRQTYGSGRTGSVCGQSGEVADGSTVAWYYYVTEVYGRTVGAGAYVGTDGELTMTSSESGYLYRQSGKRTAWSSEQALPDVYAFEERYCYVQPSIGSMMSGACGVGIYTSVYYGRWYKQRRAMSDACVPDWTYVTGYLDMAGAPEDIETYMVVIGRVVPDPEIWASGSEVSENSTDGNSPCTYGWMVGVVRIGSSDQSAATLPDAADVESVDESTYVVANATESPWTGQAEYPSSVVSQWQMVGSG